MNSSEFVNMTTNHFSPTPTEESLLWCMQKLWPPLGPAQRHSPCGPRYPGQETVNGVKSGQTPAPSRLKAAQNAGHTSCDGSLCLWRQSDTIGFLRQFFRPELCVDSCPQPAANSAIPTPSSLIPSTMGCSPLMTNGGSHRSTGRLNGLRASNASRRLENLAARFFGQVSAKRLAPCDKH